MTEQELKVGDRVRDEEFAKSGTITRIDDTHFFVRWDSRGATPHPRSFAVNLTRLPDPQPSPLSEERIVKPVTAWAVVNIKLRRIQFAGEKLLIFGDAACAIAQIHKMDKPDKFSCVEVALNLSNQMTALERELLAALRDCHESACYGDCDISEAPIRHRQPCISRAALLKRFEGVGE